MWKKNKNGTNKEIDYKRDEYCFFPTGKKYWKPYAKVLKKQKNYIEMLSLRGICLILVQTSMQKPKKECGMIIIKSVLDLEVNGSKI